MKLAGIIGGLGPESTLEYYRLLGEVYRARTGLDAHPPVLINSIQMEQVLALVRARRRDELAALLLAEVERLARAGAEFAAIAANTPHVAFGPLAARSPIPLVSIVEAVRDEASRRGLRRMAILGSRMTMEESYYADVLLPAGMEVAAPGASDRELVDRVYFGELVRGVFRDETRRALLEVVERMRTAGPVDAVILGGTELPLLFREPAYAGLPSLDTARIHVEAIVGRMLS
jgi:aspartate racemase